MKNVTRACMLLMVVHAFAALPGLAQPAKTSSFYTDRCSTLSDEIMITVFDTGENPATVTIKVTNLVAGVDSSYSVTTDTVTRGNCNWLASSEGDKSLETTVTLYKDKPYKIEFIKTGSPTRTLLSS